MQLLASFPRARPLTAGGAALVGLALCSLACTPPSERRVYGANGGGIHFDGLDVDDDDAPATDDGGPPSADADDGGAGDDAPPVDDGAADDGPPPGHGDDTGGPIDDPPGSPYVGGWDIGNCQDQIAATGTSVGQVVPDFLLTDQHGDQVRLYDFCHKAVFLVAGAFW